MNVTEIGAKESRIRCCSDGYCQRDSAEHEEYGGVLTEKRITENNITNADSRGNRILEQILSLENQSIMQQYNAE